MLDDDSLDAFREAVWGLTGLIARLPRSDGELEQEPVALHPPVTVARRGRLDPPRAGRALRGARVWGPSARFEGQRVGREHELADGDAVEILD